jgi:glycosyltransferase involved in cell wall biosynthesis
MRISVVIVTYNEEKNIKDCLDSIFSQTKKPDEVILVDDGSSDNTLKIASGYPMKILKTKHKERSHARNVGWKNSQGGLILFAEADSVFDKDWVAEIVKQFDKGAEAVIDRRKMYKPKTFLQKCLDAQFDIRYAYYKPFSAWAFRREVLEKTGGFDERLNQSEDRDLGKRVLKSGCRIFLAEKAVQYHKGEPQNLFQYFKRAFVVEKRRVEGYYEKYPKEIPNEKMFFTFTVVLLITLSLISSWFLLALFLFLLANYFLTFYKVAVMEKGWRIAEKKYLLSLGLYRLLRNIFAAVGFIAGKL